MVTRVDRIYPKKRCDNVKNLKYEDIYLERLDEITEILKNEIINNQQNRLTYVNVENDKVISEKEVILKRLEVLIDELEEYYTDELDRLEKLSLIKSNIKKLKKTVNKQTHKYYYRSCIIIHDAILNLKSEKISHEQIRALKYLFSKLKKENLDLQEFYDIDDILLENNLEWIPDLDFDDEE